MAGDFRCPETHALATTHTIFLLEHNRSVDFFTSSVLTHTEIGKCVANVRTN